MHSNLPNKTSTAILQFNLVTFKLNTLLSLSFTMVAYKDGL